LTATSGWLIGDWSRAPVSFGVWPPLIPSLPTMSFFTKGVGMKKFAMPSFCSSVVAASSHISMKNAIIAVAKSA
jgi:hypothetical protein